MLQQENNRRTGIARTLHWQVLQYSNAHSRSSSSTLVIYLYTICSIGICISVVIPVQLLLSTRSVITGQPASTAKAHGM